MSRSTYTSLLSLILCVLVFPNLSFGQGCPPLEAPLIGPFQFCEGESTSIDLTSYVNPPIYQGLDTVDFEAPGEYTTSVPEFSDGNEDFFTRTDGTNIDGGVVVNGYNGSFWFHAMDIDAEGGPSIDTIFINPINITGATGLVFSVMLAEDDDGSNNDWDDADFVKFEYSVDGGPFQDLLAVENMGATFNTAPAIDTDFDGVGDGDEITDDFQAFTSEIPETGTSISIRIVIALDAGDEDIAIDDVMLLATVCPETSFNIYDSGNTLVGDMVTSFTPVVTPGTTETFTIAETDGTNESETEPFDVEVLLAPVAVAEVASTPVCEGDDILLMETGGSAAVSWEWTYPTGEMSMDQNPTVTATDLSYAGTYQVVIVDDLGCTDTATVDVEVLTIPPAPVLEDIYVCEGGNTNVDLSEMLSNGTEILYTQDFEAGTGYTTSVPEFTDNSGDFFTRTDGGNIGSFVSVIGNSGSYWFHAMDMDGDGQPPVNTIVLDPIDISGTSNLAFSVLLAEDDDGTDEDWDESDEVLFDYSIDGGAFTPLLHIQNDGSNFNSPPYIDTDFDGTGDGAEITSAFQEFGAAIAGSGSVLTIRITIALNSGDEDIAIDDIIISEDAPVITGFNFYDGDPMGGGNLLAGDVTSYDPGGAATLFVTALNQICEGPAASMEVILNMGSQPLSCNDHVNITIGPACETEITPEMFLESDAVLPFIELVLVDENGVMLPDNFVRADQIGQTLEVKVFDACTEGFHCWGTISVEDKAPPLIMIDDVTVDCGDDVSEAALAPVTIVDCSDYDYYTVDSYTGELCEETRILMRTFHAVDEFGNESTHTQQITILPLSLDIIIEPSSVVTTDCGITSMPDIWAFTKDSTDAYPTLTNGLILYPGEYCNFIVIKTDEVIPLCDQSCSNSSKVLRHWKILDWCTSDIVEFDQIIHAKDITPPVVNPIDDMTAYVDPWSCMTSEVVLPTGSGTDNCTPDALSFIITDEDGIELSDGIARNLIKGSHNFYYRAVDCCGNVSENAEKMTVFVYDNVKPVAIAKEYSVVSVIPYGDENDIEEGGLAKVFAESIDNGSWDMCFAKPYLEVRRIDENNEPLRDNCDRDDDGSKSGYATDSPSEDYPVADRDDRGFAPFVKFCCDDVGESHMVELRVWDDADMNGTYGTPGDNYNVTWGLVKVEDKHAKIECHDVIAYCHEDIEEVIKDNIPVAYGVCDDLDVVELSRDMTGYDEVCHEGVIYITYAVEDNYVEKCTQRIDIIYKDEMTCSDINWPASYSEVECMDLEPAELTWYAGACEIIGWTLESDTFAFQSNSCLKIVNNYTVIDWCKYDRYMSETDTEWQDPFRVMEEGFFYSDGRYEGLLCDDPYENPDDTRQSPNGVYKYVEVIKLVDDIAPEILICDFDPIVTTTNCESPVTLSNLAFDRSECPYTQLKWQLLVVTEDGRSFIYEQKRLAAQVVTFTLTDENGDLLYLPASSTHYIRWKVWDGCGNVDVCETTISIVERKDPTPYCIDLSTALMNNGRVELWANDFDKGSTDDCTPLDSLRFTFDQINPDLDYLYEPHYFDEFGIVDDDDAEERYNNGEIQFWDPEKRTSAMVFTCEDLPEVDVEMTVWDLDLNYDYCIVKLVINAEDNDCDDDNRVFIGGLVTNKLNSPIANVDMVLTNVSDKSEKSTITSNTGEYLFKYIDIANDYDLTPSKEGDYKNGVSTEDILIIQKSIMDEIEWSSPYDLLASDVNDDGKVSATDLVLIQRLLLDQLTEFKAGSWRFISADLDVNVENVFNNYIGTMGLTGLQEDKVDTDFIGVKMGDVTGDAATNFRNNANTRSLDNSIVYYQDRYVEEGEVIEVTLDADEYQALKGYQFTLKLSHGEFVDVSSEANTLYQSNYNFTDDKLSVTFGNIYEDMTNQSMFTFTMKAKKSGMLSDMIYLSAQGLQPEVYLTSEIITHNLILQARSTEERELSLEQNIPNPFSDVTQISFVIPQEGQANVTVFDVSGRKVFSRTGNYTAGRNTINLKREQIDLGRGLYYYTLTFDGSRLSRKMIIID